MGGESVLETGEALDLGGQGGMGRGLADKEDVHSLSEDAPDKGLMAIEVVAQNGDLPGSQTGPPLIDPAGGRIDLAVLLLVAVLGDDELGRQGKDRFLSRSHQDRSHGEMPVEGGSIRLVGLVAGGTGDLLRLEKVQAVEGHEKGAPIDRKGSSRPSLWACSPKSRKRGEIFPGETGSSKERIWLSEGIRWTPKSERALFSPLSVFIWRWYSRKEGDWMKKTPKAARAASSIS
jgi:hypothetical protein